jgi:hypothetical protein
MNYENQTLVMAIGSLSKELNDVFNDHLKSNDGDCIPHEAMSDYYRFAMEDTLSESVKILLEFLSYFLKKDPPYETVNMIAVSFLHYIGNGDDDKKLLSILPLNLRKERNACWGE